MAATVTTGYSIPATTPVATLAPQSLTRRRITPEAGRALEILGHAIEYLTDEYVHDGVAFSACDDRLQAVQLLMSLNRQVYFECPEAHSFAQRCRSFLGLHPVESFPRSNGTLTIDRR